VKDYLRTLWDKKNTVKDRDQENDLEVFYDDDDDKDFKSLFQE